MGQRGRRPLPKNVHLLRGNPSKLSAATLDGRLEPDIAVPDCPAHLLKEARKEWKRITPELERLGLIALIDRTALALYCQEWAWWVWHDEALQRAVKISAEKAAAFSANPANKDIPWAGGNGFMLPTPNGNWTYSPHWVARNKHALYLDRFLASFGMSPSARGRVSPSTRQLTLPGVESTEGGGGFNVL